MKIKEHLILIARYLEISIPIILLIVNVALLVSVDTIDIWGKPDRYFSKVPLAVAIFVFGQNVALNKISIKNSCKYAIRILTIVLFVIDSVLYLTKLK